MCSRNSPTTGVARSQGTPTPEPTVPVHVSSSGYVGFSDGSRYLSGSGTVLELRFRACSSDGLLFHAVDDSGMEYFAVGLTDGQLLVEYRGDDGTISNVSVPFNLYLAL